MKICFVGLLILFLLYYQSCNTREGFDVPKRAIDPDLLDYIKTGLGGAITLTDKAKTKEKGHVSAVQKKFNHRNNSSAHIARANRGECSKSGNYHSCNISTPSPEQIDLRYVSIPTNVLDTSDVYTHLSICPRTYQNNMDILSNKQSIGQYSGYTPNAYIDKVRYVESKIPLPVNPDFFRPGGGTY